MNNLPADLTDVPDCAPDPTDRMTKEELLECVGPEDIFDWFNDGDGGDVCANYFDDTEFAQWPTHIRRKFEDWVEKRLRDRAAKQLDDYQEKLTRI